MLSRTAGDLFWTGRYVERADFIARLTDATLRLAALPSYYGGDVSAWTSALVAAGVSNLYAQKYPKLSEKTALHFLALDPDNPSSMYNCIERARTNARAVRTALTVEVWEAINSAWLEMQKFGPKLGAATTISRRNWRQSKQFARCRISSSSWKPPPPTRSCPDRKSVV